MFESQDKYQSWASLILRVVIGSIFLLHGLQKFGLIDYFILRLTVAVPTHPDFELIHR